MKEVKCGACNKRAGVRIQDTTTVLYEYKTDEDGSSTFDAIDDELTSLPAEWVCVNKQCPNFNFAIKEVKEDYEIMDSVLFFQEVIND